MRSIIIALALCALSVNCVGANEGETKQLANAFSDTNIQCYSCSGSSAQCYNTSENTTCEGNGQFICATDYSNYGTKLTLRCFNEVACANQEVKNDAACYNSSSFFSAKSCFFCCNTSLCNVAPYWTLGSAGQLSHQRTDFWSVIAFVLSASLIAKYSEKMNYA